MNKREELTKFINDKFTQIILNSSWDKENIINRLIEDIESIMRYKK